MGGLRREFLTLLMEATEKSALLTGPDGQKNLALDSVDMIFNLTFLTQQISPICFHNLIIIVSFPLQLSEKSNTMLVKQLQSAW